MDRIVRELRVRNMTLAALDRQYTVQGSTAPVLDGVPGLLLAGGFADQALVYFFTA